MPSNDQYTALLERVIHIEAELESVMNDSSDRKAMMQKIDDRLVRVERFVWLATGGMILLELVFKLAK